MNKVKRFFNKLASNWDENNKDDISNIEDIISYLKISSGDKILDIGCGTGIITPILSKISNNTVIGLDISNKMIKVAKNKNSFNNVKYISYDYYKYNKDKYNYIVCFNAYPHFVNLDLFIKKSYDLLLDNGILAIIFNHNHIKINSFHENINSDISRNINSPIEEGKLFEKYFNIYFSLEEENKYILLLKKK